ncbi:MAG: hypothetical protein ABIJ91_01595 [Candidatus Kuenenbacteria bacterium]
MMNRNKIIISLVVLAVVVLLGVLGYFIITKINNNAQNDKPLPDDISHQALIDNLQPEAVGNKKEDEKIVISEVDKQEINAKNAAKFFIEMLGSYATEAHFQNLKDLRPIMTARMRAWADDFMQNDLSGGQERVTTKVFKTDVLYKTGSTIKFLVYTRREQTNSSGTKLYNQNAEISLILAGGDWLADNVEWK